MIHEVANLIAYAIFYVLLVLVADALIVRAREEAEDD